MAAEIHVMSAGAVKAAVTELAKDFQKEKGHEVKFTFATVGALQQKIAAGRGLILHYVRYGHRRSDQKRSHCKRVENGHCPCRNRGGCA